MVIETLEPVKELKSFGDKGVDNKLLQRMKDPNDTPSLLCYTRFVNRTIGSVSFVK